MLVKPAEQTPLTAYALEVLALQAGLPADVLINISGDAVEVGKTLCESDIVRKVKLYWFNTSWPYLDATMSPIQ